MQHITRLRVGYQKFLDVNIEIEFAINMGEGIYTDVTG